MGQVFLSYSSQHRDLTAALAERLAEAGYPVWWDKALEAWGGYEPQIREALQAAAVVVVIWSRSASESLWVYSEALRAQAAGKLVHVRAPDFPVTDIPGPFNAAHVHTLDLADLDPLLKSIRAVWRGAVPATLTPLHVHYRNSYGVELFASRCEPAPTDLRQVSPSALLQAQHRMVPYVDATGLFRDLLDWCRGEGAYAVEARTTAGRLLCGPGGLGKTRLMIECAARLREDGWLAGFVDPPRHGADSDERRDREQAVAQIFAHGDEPGVLMVIDYVEARCDELLRLARLARTRARAGVRPVRIVLLSRGDAWWRELYDREPDVEILFQRFGKHHGDATAMEPLPAGEPRLAFFEQTLAAYRPLAALLAEAGSFPLGAGRSLGAERRRRLMEDGAFSRPLALQMEALLQLAGESPLDGGVETLLDRIVRLERRHWSRVIEGLAGDEAREHALRRGVCQVTAVGGVETRRQGEMLLCADPYFGSRPPAEVPYRELQRLYGRPGVKEVLAPLEPDLVGEHEIALSADELLLEGCLSWIASLPEREQSQRRRTLITVLQRATRPEHGSAAEAATALLNHLIMHHFEASVADLVAVAGETPGGLSDRLIAHLDDLADGELAALQEQLPDQTVVLAELKAMVSERRVRRAREACAPASNAGGDRQVALAVALDSLARAEFGLGHRAEALAASEEALAIRRQLADSLGDSRMAGLADSLHDRGVFLSALGRQEEGMASTDEALAIRRRLAELAPDEGLPDLARSLNNLGIRLFALGRRQAALEATEEAVAIRRRLADAAPDLHLADLAQSLNNLGRDLYYLGRLEEALAASGEAVTLYRRLAESRPDAFLADLAQSMANRSVFLSALGHGGEAVAAAEEAVAIRRELAEARPEAFLAGLADSLGNLGIFLSRLGREDEALKAAEEAVELQRRLAEQHPEAYLSDLAQGLVNLGTRLAGLGRTGEALTATEEAVDLHRRLLQADPETFRPDLAASVNNLAVWLSDLGRLEEALAAAEEAVAIRRRLAEAGPDSFLPDLAESMETLSSVLLRLGRDRDARAAAAKGLAIIAPFAERHPNAFGQLAAELLRTVDGALPAGRAGRERS